MMNAGPGTVHAPRAFAAFKRFVEGDDAGSSDRQHIVAKRADLVRRRLRS
jgi:hypothetical protein